MFGLPLWQQLILAVVFFADFAVLADLTWKELPREARGQDHGLVDRKEKLSLPDP